jgi:hypothetical protein
LPNFKRTLGILASRSQISDLRSQLRSPEAKSNP